MGKVSDIFHPGDIVRVMPWELSMTSSWPIGYTEIGIVCGPSKKVSLVGEVYEVMVEGIVKEVPRDSLEKVQKK